MIAYFPLPSIIEKNSILIYFAFVIVISEIFARIYYSGFTYTLTSDELIIKRGRKVNVIRTRDITNVYVLSGLIPKLFGFSILVINTANARSFLRRYLFFPRLISQVFGIYPSYSYDGYLPAVSHEEAINIQNFLLSRNL